MFVEEPRFWEEQRQHCNELGGELASIPNFETTAFLVSLIKKTNKNQKGTSYTGGIHRPYNITTGMLCDLYKSRCDGSDIQSQWEWIDGRPFTFRNWAIKEPSGDGPLLTMQVGSDWTGDGTWNDVASDRYKPGDRNPALCQKSNFKKQGKIQNC